MIESAQGIILRTRPLTDTSLIVHWLTPELGRVATVAKGARRPKSPFAGKLDFAYTADFTFHRSRRSELHILREVALRETHPHLREQLLALQQAAYAVSFIEQSTEPETSLPEIYAVYSGWLDWLGQAGPGAVSLFAFELKLLAALGLQPDLAETALNPGARQLAARLLDTDWPGLGALRLSGPQEQDLRQFLHGYLIYHLGRLPHGRAAALA